MRIKTILFLIFLFLFSFGKRICAQEKMNKNWDSEKIKGTRLIPTPAYSGFPLLYKGWLSGNIEFTDGEIADSLNLKYSSYKDDVIYYNSALQSQIIIDKASLNGFSIVENNGKTHVFRKQFYDGFFKGYRYFEVLSDGETKLLVYRKINLNTIPAYTDSKGVMINMAYEPEYQYYFYSAEKKYVSVKLNRSDLLSKFEKDTQKPIKKLLRKNRVTITDESTFEHAWKVIENAGYKVIF